MVMRKTMVKSDDLKRVGFPPYTASKASKQFTFVAKNVFKIAETPLKRHNRDDCKSNYPDFEDGERGNLSLLTQKGEVTHEPTSTNLGKI